MSDVRITDLKAHLSEHLRSVQQGATLTVLERNTPVARIILCVAQPLEIRKATRCPRDLKLPPRLATHTDGVTLLLEAAGGGDRVGPLPVVATHDVMLGTAARAFGFDVRGV